MAITLTDVNNTLLQVEDNTDKTSRGLSAFVEHLRTDKRKDLEKEREAKNVNASESARQASAGGGSGSGGSGGGLLGGIRSAFAGATLASLAPMLGKTLLKRVLGPGAIALFAEDIVELLLPDGLENEDLKNSLTGGLQGAALGFMVGGPLGAAIGGGVGALMKNEKFKEAITELGKTLKDMAKDLYEKLEPTLINLKEKFVEFFDSLGITKEGVTKGLAKALKTIGDAAASGVESLTKLIKGDFDGMDIVKGITTLGVVATLLMPGKFLKLFGLLAAFGKGAGMKALTALKAGGGKLLTSAMAGLGLSTAAGAVKDTDMVTSKSGKQYRKDSPQGKVIQAFKKTGEVPKAAAINKFPKLLKALNFLKGVPLVGGIAALAQIAAMDPITVDKLAGVFGGIGGAALGAVVGALTPIPGGMLIGGGLGAVLGDTLAQAAAQYFMGKKVDAFGFGFGWLNDLINGKKESNQPTVGTDAMRMGRGGPTQTFTKPGGPQRRSGPDVITGAPSTSATTMQSNISRGNAPEMENTSIVANSGNSTTNNINNNSTGLLMGKPEAIDNSNPILQRVVVT